MAKHFTDEELRELAEEGATVEFDPERLIVDGWESLIEQMNKLVQANEAIARKQAVEVETAINKLTEVLAQKNVNMTPVISLLGDIRESLKPKQNQVERLNVIRKSETKLIDYVEVQYKERKMH